MELVGMSRVDKPSVSEQLQPILPEPHTSSLGSTPSTTGSRPGQDTLRPEPGLRYQDTIDPDSSPRARIRYVPARKHLPTGMYAAVDARLSNHIAWTRRRSMSRFFRRGA